MLDDLNEPGRAEHAALTRPYSKSGYRSNEHDENDELAKLSARNAINCYQKLISIRA